MIRHALLPPLPPIVLFLLHVWSHLLLCKELKCLMFLVDERGSESGFSVTFKFGN